VVFLLAITINKLNNTMIRQAAAYEYNFQLRCIFPSADDLFPGVFSFNVLNIFLFIFWNNFQPPPPHYDRISRLPRRVPACRLSPIRFHSKPFPCLAVIFSFIVAPRVFTSVDRERYRYQLLLCRLMFLVVVTQSRGQINFFYFAPLFIIIFLKKREPRSVV
jgi:hypothetical protein